jgi:hypothetical protein
VIAQAGNGCGISAILRRGLAGQSKLFPAEN